jgi:hypothetical protein
MSMQVSILEKVPLRQAFPKENENFTAWLEENIGVLAKNIGLTLTVLEREKSVGTFKVDLFCEDDERTYVVIENQLEKSDHDHLGKLLTYMVNLEAKKAVWVVSEARPEHQTVIRWLNESTGVEYGFYLVQVEAVRIGESPYAPLFTVLTAPDEQLREIGESKKELAERYYLREHFWTSLLQRVEERKVKLFSNISPSRNHWLSTGAGKSGIVYSYLIWQGGAGVELYIDVGNQEENKRIFDHLEKQKSTIEDDFGEALIWQRLEEKRACRILKRIEEQGSLREEEKWPALQDIMIEYMSRLEKALCRHIKNL